MNIELDNLPIEISSRISVDSNTGCWIWIKPKNKYARVTYKGRFWLVHRLVYTLLVGEFPPGTEASHICKNKRCCYPNSNHVISESRKENLARNPSRKGIPLKPDSPVHDKSKNIYNPLFCRKGHPVEGNKLGKTNRCKICHREKMNKKRKEKLGKV